MIEQSTLLRELKAALFDVTYQINTPHVDINDIFKQFKQTLKEQLNASSVAILFHQALLEQQISSNGSQTPHNPVHHLSVSTLIEQFESEQNVLILHQDHLQQASSTVEQFALKLHVNGLLKAILLLSFAQKQTELMPFIESIQQSIERSFSVIYRQYQKSVIHERTKLLFQLSTVLHSVHQTTQVLENAYKTMRQMYPDVRFCFLMSQECEHTNVPMQLINYNGKGENALGTLAFINDEVQLEEKIAENETVIYAPLSGEQGVYGVLKMIAPKRIQPSPSELDFIHQMTDMIGRAVERTTLYQSSNQLVTDLQLINVASRELNKNLEKQTIAENIIKHIVNSCKTEEVGIVLMTENDQDYATEFSLLKESSPFFHTEEGMRLIEYFYQRLNENSEPLLSGNFTVDNFDMPFHSVMMIPMLESEQLLGFIIILHEVPYYFSLDKYKFVQSFVQHASLAISNSILKEQLRKTAITDYLTKLYLRNYLNEKVEEHMANANRGAFILFDIDDFKLVNDTYGHTIGDKVLIQVAHIIQENISEKDIPARWGGEEFAVYLPNKTIDDAIELAERIRRDALVYTDPQVSLSMGVTTWDYGENSMEHLFIRADEALYEAKAKGKNRVIYR